MKKILAVLYAFFCMFLALVFDQLLNGLKQRFLVLRVRILPFAISGWLIDLVFGAALLFLVWLVLFRFEKSAGLSIVFIVLGVVSLFLPPLIFAYGRVLLRGLPSFLGVIVLRFLDTILPANSFFAITNTFILGVGTANLFRRQ